MPQAVKSIPIQRLNDIVAVLDQGITAKSIASHISSTAMQSDRRVREARDLMKLLDFDRVAVSQGVTIIGYVDVKHLSHDIADDPVGLHARPFEPELLVSDETSLPTVLRRMEDQPAVFVVGGDGVDGIITHADLEKQCMRIYLFGLVSLLEQQLCKTMNRLSYQDVVAALDTSVAREGFERVFDQKKAVGEELPPVYYTTLSTKKDLVMSHEEYWRLMGPTRSAVAEKLGNVIKLRNALDHINLLSGAISSWSSLSAAIDNVTDVIGRLERAETHQ